MTYYALVPSIYTAIFMGIVYALGDKLLGFHSITNRNAFQILTLSYMVAFINLVIIFGKPIQATSTSTIGKEMIGAWLQSGNIWAWVTGSWGI
jgi:hypothetical protein